MIVWGGGGCLCAWVSVWVSGVVVVWCVVSGCGGDGETVTRPSQCRFKTFSCAFHTSPYVPAHMDDFEGKHGGAQVHITHSRTNKVAQISYINSYKHMSRIHAHTTTHIFTSSRTFRFVLRLCPSKKSVLVCVSPERNMCASLLVLSSQAQWKWMHGHVKVQPIVAWEWFWVRRFYGRALGCVLQDVVSTEIQVDFTEGPQKFRDWRAACNSEKLHHASSIFGKEGVHWQVWSNVLIFMRV